MDDMVRNSIIDRAKNVISILRQSNSGADIHEVLSMRSIAENLIEILGTVGIPEPDAKDMISRLEIRLIAYLQRKYRFWRRK